MVSVPLLWALLGCCHFLPFPFLLFLCVLCTRIESSLSRVVLFGLSCVRSVFYVLGGLVELEPREYNCGLRYLTVSCTCI